MGPKKPITPEQAEQMRDSLSVAEQCVYQDYQRGDIGPGAVMAFVTLLDTTRRLLNVTSPPLNPVPEAEGRLPF